VWLHRGFDSFKIRVEILSTIGGIPLSLLVIRYDVFGVRVVTAQLVGHSYRDDQTIIQEKKSKL
jgi:hypothetical protein